MCAESGGAWHFTSCPACQCNGHSNCSLASALCDQPCQHNTQVPHTYRYLQSCGSGMILSDLASATVTPTAPLPALSATSPASTIHRYHTYTNLQSYGSRMIFSDPASATVTPTAPSPALCATNPASTIHRYGTTPILTCSLVGPE